MHIERHITFISCCRSLSSVEPPSRHCLTLISRSADRAAASCCKACCSATSAAMQSATCCLSACWGKANWLNATTAPASSADTICSISPTKFHQLRVKIQVAVPIWPRLLWSASAWNPELHTHYSAMTTGKPYQRQEMQVLAKNKVLTEEEIDAWSLPILQ